MENSVKIRKLLLKFVEGDCSQVEIDQVVTYFQTTRNTEDFPTVEDVVSLMEEIPRVDATVSKKILQNILSEEKTEKKFRRYVWKYASIAALFMGLIGLGIFYQQGVFETKSDFVIPGNDVITLELDNGTIKVIDEDGETQVVDKNGEVVGQQEGSQLVYTTDENLGELVYNTLTVPYGKRFDVELSDGTIVYLNAGTSLRYPINFLKGQERQVYLIGEAYFDVTEDREHPFVVNAEQLNVQVLGTKFNVSNYPEDSRTDVVLVEGSVGMYGSDDAFNEREHKILIPGTKGSFDRTDLNIVVNNVVTSTYTSWVEGRLIFRNMPFDNILKKLERRYNIDIENSNSELGAEEFNAGFRDESIDEILEALRTTYGIEFSIKDNKVIIE